MRMNKLLFRIFSIVVLGIFIGMPTRLRNEYYANFSNTKQHIIFDLGGVLVDTNIKSALSELGLANLLRYKITTGKSPSNIKKVLYKVLHIIQPIGNYCCAIDPDGDQIPGLMCDWMRGIKSNAELREIILSAILSNKNWFLNSTEQRLVYRLARTMFSPERFVRSRKIIKDGLEFVAECKKRGYVVHVLSNWDTESFELLKEKYPKLFNLFDNIIISGNVSLLKPTKEIYHVFTKNFPHSQCIFIDDQKKNVESALACGMQAIHCPSKKGYISSAPDFNAVRKQLAKIEKARSNNMVAMREVPA